jgi:hypothetical protein
VLSNIEHVSTPLSRHRHIRPLWLVLESVSESNPFGATKQLAVSPMKWLQQGEDLQRQQQHTSGRSHIRERFADKIALSPCRHCSPKPGERNALSRAYPPVHAHHGHWSQ